MKNVLANSIQIMKSQIIITLIIRTQALFGKLIPSNSALDVNVILGPTKMCPTLQKSLFHTHDGNLTVFQPVLLDHIHCAE